MNPPSVKSAARWRIRNDELPLLCHADGQSQTLPVNLGSGQSTTLPLDADLSYIESDYRPSCDLAILTQMPQHQPRLVVTLGMQGQSCFVDHQGRQIPFKEGFTSITVFNGSSGERHYQADEMTSQLRFSVSQAWLQRYIGEQAEGLFRSSSVRLLSCKPIATATLVACRQLMGCKVEQPGKRLFMHAQALFILAAEMGHLWLDSAEIATTLNPKDQLLAHAARQILLKEFKHPPSVPELARRVGTNQCKLKQVFHHIFNITPYGMLLEIRMARARQLLESGRYSINAVAEQVGYQHASNFSAAFSRHFGATPRDLRKPDARKA